MKYLSTRLFIYLSTYLLSFVSLPVKFTVVYLVVKSKAIS